MKKLHGPLALAAAFGVAGVLGTNYLSADPPPAAPPPAAAAKPDPAAKNDGPMAPVKVSDAKVETRFAVTPKPLSPAVKKGLEYLVKNQQEDGGWNQGGGWRTAPAGGGGRVEGANVEDPSDVGNTCIALLALIRAGNTPVEGQYKENVQKGLRFVLTRIEKSDPESLYVTDVKGTQLQSKIGPYVDTFLANLVLAELKGKSGADEKRLIAALEKTMNKIVKHQDANGGFANNGGWAPTLSVGIANKSVARAKQNGVEVDQKVLDRAFAQSKMAAGPAGPAMPAGVGGGGVGAKGGPAPVGGPAPAARAGLSGGGDAGVRLYSVGQGAGNTQDVVNGLKVDAEKAKKVLEDPNAPKDAKDKAQKQVDDYKKAEGENRKVQEQLAREVKDQNFVAGFGSNGGEEFLSFLNISEALLIKGGKDWEEWDAKMTKGLEKAQNGDGSWSGQHCITGKTFCTAAALLVLMADRTPFPVDVLKKDEPKPEPPAKP
jgi:hypothetical protein